MQIIYQSVKFKPELVISVYAREFSNGEVKVVEVNLKGKTIREWATHKDKYEHADKLNGWNTVQISGPTLQERERMLK